MLLTLSHTEILTIDTISNHIQNGINTRIKGSNKVLIEKLYENAGYRPLWFKNGNDRKTSQLIQALNDPLFNYKNKNFDRRAIKRLFYLLDNSQISPQKKAAVYARLDLLLTNAYLHLLRFIVQGDVDWALVQKKMANLEESDDIKARWEMHPKQLPSIEEISNVLKQGDLRQYFESLLPMERRYRKLVDLLKDYRRMQKFPKIPYRAKIYKIGDKSPDILLIKKRLQISGDYPREAPLDKNFDETLRQAVLTYQKRYLLKVTGMVDRTVTYYLNQPAEKNIRAIIINLDKTKLYPKHFEEEYVEVNVPDFNLRYYKEGQQILKMGVVVGRIDRPTPIFDDRIEYMVLNPTWTIPDNLIKRDLIHVLREEPDYLQSHNIHVFKGNREINVTQEMLDPYEHSDERVPYRFVQYPGDDNALGRIKFMFPNKYAVYLHDTDNKTLFGRRYKVYSSGCMRVERPFDLMNILLEHTKGFYSQSDIEEILSGNKPTTIKLKQPIPVHILYFTVYKEDGLAYFKNDIYMYDQIIYESSNGHRKETFTVPKKRLITIKKQKKAQEPLSN
jgi:murein L,D-transpeptidase YcbB/YkuD